MDELKLLKAEVKQLRELLEMHTKHCDEMFKAQLEGQKINNERIALVSNRLHHHLTNL